VSTPRVPENRQRAFDVNEWRNGIDRIDARDSNDPWVSSDDAAVRCSKWEPNYQYEERHDENHFSQKTGRPPAPQ
jgi:hypothetical protein